LADLAKRSAYSLVQEFVNDPPKIYDYIEELLRNIERREEKVKAFITLIDKKTLFDRVESLAKIKNLAGMLYGIAVAIKDNISTKSIRTTCGSKMLENYVPPYNATVVKKLLNEGAIIIGKTNMDEFAMGSTTEFSSFYPTRNPWDLTRVPGGSSGGSAAALAAGFASLALGSDTGGSVRNPASFTATYALRPTYGLVSRFGLIAYASSMDQIGPMARSTYDLALLLDVIAGHDPYDATSLPVEKTDYVSALRKLETSSPRLRIGIAKNLIEMASEDVKQEVLRVLDELCEYHECSDIDIPYPRQAVAAYYIIALSEASSNLARYDGVRYGLKMSVENKSWIDVYTEVRSKGFGFEVKKRIALGSLLLSLGFSEQYYINALRFRRFIRDEVRKLFKKVDVIATPTMPILPPKIGELVEDPIMMWLSDVYTVIASLTGIPAISVPAGFRRGLPVGIQFMADVLREDLLLFMSLEVEKITGISNMIAEV